MVKKSMMLAAFGIGYVVGARAGRERYDAIVAKAQGWWQDPRVQEAAGKAQNSVRDAINEHAPGAAGPTPDSGTLS